MRRLLTARSSRFSTRYDAKKMARRILANSPGWKLIGPMLTQIRAPKYSRPMPGHEREQQERDAEEADRPAVALEVADPADTSRAWR